VLRDSVRVFERYEKRTIEEGGPELMNVIRRVTTVLDLYFARVLAGRQLLKEAPLTAWSPCG
jgi:hypothetical protein